MPAQFRFAFRFALPVAFLLSAIPAAAQSIAAQPAKKPAPTIPAVAGKPKALPAPPAKPTKPKAEPAGISELRKLSEGFAAVAEKVSPSVVQIEVVADAGTASSAQFVGSDGERKSTGSGVIFSSSGAIITNNHVIEGARSINVRLKDGRIMSAELAGRDPATDLAVIRIQAEGLPTVEFADSDAAKVGEWVVAIGSPFGLGSTVTTGVLSAKGRGVGVNAVEDYLQTDASINPGNSGGPLVNLDGHVLGINTMIVSRGQGIGLAVPARLVKRVADQLLKTGRVTRAYVGIGLQDLTPQLAAELTNPPSAGALVNSVTPGGPAQQANLEPGDVVTQVDGKPTANAQDVIREIFSHDVGETISLEVVRLGKRYQTKATLKERKEEAPPQLPIERKLPSQPRFGLTLRDVVDNEKPKGSAGSVVSVVVEVAPDSMAERAGVRAGDMILDADDVRLPTTDQVNEKAQDGRLLLRLRRKSATFYTAIRK